MADDAEIRITGDATSAVRAISAVRTELDRTAASVRKLSAEDQRAQAAAKAEAAIWKGRSDNINAWKRAASGVAPQLTGIIDSMEEFAEGSERVGGASMLARVGVLALGSAFTIAAAATVAAGAAIVGSSLEVITHLRDYSGVATRHRGALEDAAAATSGLHTRVTELRVELAGQMAPAIAQTSDAMTGLVDVIGDAEAGLYDLTDSVGISAHGLAGYVPVLGDVVRLYDQLAVRGRQARMEAAGAAAGAAAARAIASGSSPKFNMESDASAAAQAQAEADAMMLVARGHTAAASATRGNTAAHVAQAPVVDASIQQAIDYARRLTTQRDILEDIDRAERERAASIVAQVEAIDATVSGDIGTTQAKVDEAANAMVAGSQRVRASWQSTVAGIAGTANAVLGTLSRIVNEYTDMQVGSFEEADATQRRLLRERFRREKASAIAMAVIQGALSVVQTLASTPYPLNIVLGIAQAAAVAAEVAVMSRQQPTYHTSGLAPDETMTYGGAKVLRSETMAIYSDRRAPSEGDVSRAHTGERSRPEAAPLQPITLTIDGRRERTRRHAGPSTGYLPGRMAYGV